MTGKLRRIMGSVWFIALVAFAIRVIVAAFLYQGQLNPRRDHWSFGYETGSPWENGYCESFNGKLQDECLNGEIFYSLKEAQIVIEKWRVEYNTRRPHSALGYRPPAPAACSPLVAPNSSSQALAVM